MKAIKFIATVVFAGIIFYQAQQKQESAINISLNGVEALAQSENGQENKYSYTYPFGETCTVYVGGAYATGKKVDCFHGYDHPVCVDCTL